MSKTFKIAAACALLAQSSAVMAELIVQPVPVAEETARYDRGLPTITIWREKGALQVRPRKLDHGSVAFDVAVYNRAAEPANFDTSNVEATVDGMVIRPLTLVELEKKAKSRAMWSQIGVAVLAGVAAGAMASQRDEYTSTVSTPHGVYRGYYSAPSVGGQLAAAGMVAGGGVAIASIDNQLKATLDNMQDNVIQITTINPGDSYAGMLVLQKAKSKKLPLRVDVKLTWNGETYPFAFRVVKEGTPMPQFAAITAVTANPETATTAPAATAGADLKSEQSSPTTTSPQNSTPSTSHDTSPL
jgi:hypothetical protein